MGEFRATPGPWHARFNGISDEVVTIREPNDGRVALLTRTVATPPDEDTHLRSQEEHEANAHLIAAVPELYSALETSAHALETIARKLDEVAHTQLADILRAGAKEQRAVMRKARGEA